MTGPKIVLAIFAIIGLLTTLYYLIIGCIWLYNHVHIG
jgi:hypothetical protein